MEVLSRSLKSAKPTDRTKSGAGPTKDGTAEEDAQPSGRAPAADHAAQRRPKEVGGKNSTSTARGRAATSATGKRTGTAAAARREDLSALTKAELYRRAADVHNAHRSTMTRDELRSALEKAGLGRHLRFHLLTEVSNSQDLWMGPSGLDAVISAAARRASSRTSASGWWRKGSISGQDCGSCVAPKM